MSSGRANQDDLVPEDEELLSLYDEEYLNECASGTAREERLAELRRRIRQGAYCVDAERIAEEMLRRGDLSDE
jgi:anti-sigma28 factor (negative regulator of flagellin synthesis)